LLVFETDRVLLIDELLSLLMLDELFSIGHGGLIDAVGVSERAGWEELVPREVGT
jgi:hypothetical protein